MPSLAMHIACVQCALETCVKELLTLTHSTSEFQAAVAFGAPDLLMLTTARPVCRASSHTLVPTKPLPPKTINFGGPSYVLYRQQRVLQLVECVSAAKRN